MRHRTNQASQDAETARVLPFRPRTSATAPYRDTAVADLALQALTDTHDTAPDDFRHRMLVNAAGFACAVTLTAAGIWLASSIADLRKTQDCVLTGRRDCAPVAAVIDKQSLPMRQH